MPPNADHQIGLTIAGLRYISDASALLGAALETIKYLVDAQSLVTPSPTTVVEATVTSAQIARHLLSKSIEGSSAPPVEMTMTKLYELLCHEPIMFSGTSRLRSDQPGWQVRVPWVLRQLRGVQSLGEYVERVVAYVAPPNTEPWRPPERDPDLPVALGYLNAVWHSLTGHDLFAGFDPVSVVRLTRRCESESDFDSLLSALADVLGQVVAPGTAKPPQRQALEEFSTSVSALFDESASERVREAVGRLIAIRSLRASTQHADARHRAVRAFVDLGLPFPPPSWPIAWRRVAIAAEQGLRTIREEALANRTR